MPSIARRLKTKTPTLTFEFRSESLRVGERLFSDNETICCYNENTVIECLRTVNATKLENIVLSFERRPICVERQHGRVTGISINLTLLYTHDLQLEFAFQDLS